MHSVSTFHLTTFHRSWKVFAVCTVCHRREELSSLSFAQVKSQWHMQSCMLSKCSRILHLLPLTYSILSALQSYSRTNNARKRTFENAAALFTFQMIFLSVYWNLRDLYLFHIFLWSELFSHRPFNTLFVDVVLPFQRCDSVIKIKWL